MINPYKYMYNTKVYNMLDWSAQFLQDQLSALDDTTQIIFVHPQYPYQNRVVHLLTQQDNALYICLVGDNLTHHDLNTQVAQFVDDDTSEQIDLIIIDECDRVKQPELDTFLHEFALTHPDKRIAIVSRMVAHQLLEDAEFSKRCQFIPVDEDLMLYDYARRDRSQTLVEVRAFGSGRVHINGRPIDVWDGILPRRLFFYFADRGMVTRNDIFKTFWPDLNKREATNVFHVTKRKITDILGISFTKFASGFYRIAPDIVLSYDIIRFTQLVQDSVIKPDPEKMLESAISLYRSPYLNSEASNDIEWIQNRREEIHEMYGEALSNLAEHKLKNQHTEQALGYYLSALKILNHREEIVEHVMQIYRDRGQLDDAMQLYDWITANLQSDYGIEPSTTLKELASLVEQELQATV